MHDCSFEVTQVFVFSLICNIKNEGTINRKGTKGYLNCSTEATSNGEDVYIVSFSNERGGRCDGY